MALTKLTLYQIDAFTGKVFKGNPAAVCILEEWLDDKILQKIAAENNLSETAFVVPREDFFEIRWFTPAIEVALCGHATLATAHVLFLYHHHPGSQIRFYSEHSGDLSVSKRDDVLTLDFPADTPVAVNAPEKLLQAFSETPLEVLQGKTDYMLVFPDEAAIRSSEPDMNLLRESKARGIIITAPGEKVDFVSRFFAPGSGIDEDPVTGSAHTTLSPYWSEKLGKQKLKARQLSARGGRLLCEMLEERVLISGKAVTYMIGTIQF